MSNIKKILYFLVGAIRDPISNDASSARLIALMCAMTGCGVAVFRNDPSTIVAALISGGAVAIVTRTKSDDSAS